MEKLSPVLPPLYWLSLFASLYLCFRWVRSVPSAGIAIGALGAVGIFVAIKGEKLHEGHKVIWAFITLIFLVTEVRAIRKERTDQADKQAETIETIVRGYTTEITQNQHNFQTTMSKLDAAIARLDTMNSTNVTAQTEERKQFSKLVEKQQDLFERQLEFTEFLNGKLLPASDPMPTNTCGHPIQSNDVVLFLGTNAMVTNKFPHTVVKVHGKDAVSLDRIEDGSLVLSVDMRDASNRIVARLNKNGFVVNSNYPLFMLRPDKSTVIIEDQFGEEMLHARFLNRQAFSLSGVLHYKGTTIPLEAPFMQRSCVFYGGVDIAID